MDQSFLKEVQAKGWHIGTVSENVVVAPCPNASCNVRVKLKSGTSIPQACELSVLARSQVVTVFDDARVFLRERREDLHLSIKDVECIAGITDDFLAKFEKDGPSKYPSVQTFVEWAKGLGFAVVLVPSELTPMALRVIADTRHLIPARSQVISRYRAMRKASSEK